MIITPGKNPVRKRPSKETLLIMLYRIIPMLGGIMTPRLGDVVMTPMVYFSRYPFSINAGIMNPPRATTVATVDPEMAPKSPHPKTPAIPRPPGSQLTRTLATLMSLSTMEPAVMMFPQRMK